MKSCPSPSRLPVSLRAGVVSLCLLLLFTSAVLAQNQIDAARSTRITLLQLNDVYQISPVERGARGGLARVAALRREIMKTSPHTLFVLGGDTLSPSVASTIFQGRQMIAVWNAVGLDYAVLGNHEFDFGDDVLRERMKESRFTWFGANVIDRRTNRPFNDMPPFVIRDMGGARVGLFGVLTPDTAKASKPSANVQFTPPCEAARPVVREMRRQGAQLVVALTHLTMREDKELATCVGDIDLILGGHEHTVLQSLAGRTPILKMGSDARNLGRIDLFVSSNGKLESMDWELIPVTNEVADAPDVASVVGVYEKQLSAELDKPVGSTTVALDALQRTNRTRETNLGSYIADAYRRWAKSDIALVNGGSIRSNTVIPAGVLTKRDLLTILPFGNHVVKVEVTGKLLREALEHGVARIVEDLEDGRFPQVSGMEFTFDGRRPAGNRVTSVTVGGQPLDPARKYTMATAAYLVGGGDGYTMLAENARLLIDPEEGPIEAALLIEAVAAAKEIAPRIENRVRRADDAIGAGASR